MPIEPILEQWRRLWSELGSASDDALFHELLRRYSEPHRKYHTAQHLAECLDLYSAVKPDALHPAEVELAIWFHDAVYDPKQSDNEERSADWARTVCLQAQLDADVADRVHSLVIATRHDAASSDLDAQIIVDVDLAILGAPPERFDEYERQIRDEYDWVPQPVFRQKRRAILQTFLMRPRIFTTERLFQTREAQARDNLARSIQKLAK